MAVFFCLINSEFDNGNNSKWYSLWNNYKFYAGACFFYFNRN